MGPHQIDIPSPFKKPVLAKTKGEELYQDSFAFNLQSILLKHQYTLDDVQFYDFSNIVLSHILDYFKTTPVGTPNVIVDIIAVNRNTVGFSVNGTTGPNFSIK